jgi:hypothetical protein
LHVHPLRRPRPVHPRALHAITHDVYFPSPLPLGSIPHDFLCRPSEVPA